jgi:hypothetical protein
MANALVPAEAPRLPAHIAARMAARQNIPAQETVPSLGFQGKVWTVNVNGEATQIMREVDGENVPAAVFRVVILDWAKEQGRALYAKVEEDGTVHFTTFVPGKSTKPLCYSDDGIKADKSIFAQPGKPFAGWTGSCEGCPMSIKGSRISDSGTQGVGCAKHRMISVIPHNQLNGTPLRLKLPTTSDYDGRSPDLAAQGWFAFKNFVKDLRDKGYTDTATFVTKMKFDPNVTYPKIMFHYERWLSEAEDAVVGPLAESPFVKNLLNGTWTPTGADGVKKEEEPDDEPEAEPIKTPPPPTVVTAKPEPVKAAAPAAQAPSRVAMTDDEDEAPTPPPAPPKATATKAAQKAAPVVPSRAVPANVAAIIGAWEPPKVEGAASEEEPDE